MKGACAEDQHLRVGHARKRGMLQTGVQLEIVDPRRRVVVEDFADGVKLDEIPAQRPSQESCGPEGPAHRNAAQDHTDRERHPGHRLRFASPRHRPEPAPSFSDIAILAGYAST